MASYTPHKQTALIAILCIAAVGGTFVYTKGGISALDDSARASSDRHIDSLVTTQSPRDASVLATSTDWRSSFFTTTSTPLIRPQNTPAPTENLTLTDQFGREFFARYIQLKQSGLISDEQFVTDTLDNTISKAADAAQKSAIYTSADITIETTADQTTLRAYGNAVAGIFSQYGVDEDPATVAHDAFERGDLRLLSELDPVIAAYDTITTLLKKTPVPQPLSAYHLDLINAVSGMAQITRDLRNMEGDAMQAMVSISRYSGVQTSLIDALRSIKTYFSIVPIVFAPTEPGSLFSINL